MDRGLKRIANTIKIQTQADPTPCPGAYGTYSNQYDPRADRIYHVDNPGATVCTDGMISPSVTTKTVLGFHFPNLNDAERELMSIGPLNSNEAIFLTSQNQVPINIRRYEWPNGSDLWWRIEEGFPKDVQLNNNEMVYYAKSVKE